MTDQIETINRTVKLRTVEISVINAGPKIKDKSVIFKHVICPSSADGTKIKKPLASHIEQINLTDLISDPRVQQAMALIDAVAQDRLAMHRSLLLGKIDIE